MLTITIKGEELWDEVDQKFVDNVQAVLNFEHSLVSLSKWESIWQKPYLSQEEKTEKEILSYVECMVLNPDFSPEVLRYLTQSQWDQISEYISRDMTATTFRDVKNDPKSRETVTTEIIYYWLVQYQIPFEVQYWHLSRLMTFIRVINEKNAPKKKLSRAEAAAEQRRLNEERRRQLGSKG